jgi:glycosyltransferase involved in cell wall biosynthesis
MKVLMVNTPQSPKLKGGDTVQMEKTAEALRQMEVQVVTRTDAEPDGRGFDIAHVFNLRTIEATERQVTALSRYGIPVVMSPIYLEISEALWGSTAVAQIFSEPRRESDIAELLEKLKQRKLDLQQPVGAASRAAPQDQYDASMEILRGDGINRPFPDYDERQRRILSQVRHLLPNSAMEMSALMRTLGVTSIPFTVVPYGAEAGLFLNADPAPFIKRFGIRDFALQVGRLEPAKNQAMLCYALSRTDVAGTLGVPSPAIPLVLIGHPAHRAYAEACRRLLPKGSLIIEHLPQEQLASAYAAARVHALPSWVETCGLVTMEAALADCSLVLSTAGYECEYYAGYGYYCDPADADSIREAVRNAWDNHAADAARRRALRSTILQEYTWELAAQRSLLAYQSALANA